MTRAWSHGVLAALLLTGAAAGAAQDPPQTVAFQDGVSPSSTYAGTRDVTLSENAPATAFGAGTACSADGDDPPGSGKDAVTLLQWDVSAIPPGSTVLTAEITLVVTNASADTYELYRLARDWSEPQATWNEAAAGAPWGTPGAGPPDRGFDVRGTVSAGAAGPVTIALNSPGITAVQSWVDDPLSNYGFTIVDGANSDGVAFASRESPTPSQRPRLVVTYAPPSAGAALPDGGEGFCGSTGAETVLLFALLAFLRAVPGRRRV